VQVSTSINNADIVVARNHAIDDNQMAVDEDGDDELD